MRIVSIISQKGGAGKTTLAINLAVGAVAQGVRVTLFDLDPQATAATWGDRRSLAAPQVISAQAARLPQLLQQVDGETDWVFIDTPPALSNTTLAAIRVASHILTPCRAAIFDLDALAATLELARMGRRQAWVVLNATPHRGPDAAEARTLIAHSGAAIAPVSLGQRAAFQHAATVGLGVIEYEPAGKAASEVRELLSWLQSLDSA